MGQGQSDVAVQQLRECSQNGDWLCLKNLHLVTAWLPVLEKVGKTFSCHLYKGDTFLTSSMLSWTTSSLKKKSKERLLPFVTLTLYIVSVCVNDSVANLPYWLSKSSDYQMRYLKWKRIANSIDSDQRSRWSGSPLLVEAYQSRY